ncbi:hypothetical protein GGX14DRAFT_577033 [Mycena pura]|uniref:Uncharacterized protein n=1 Tax=Mycena pura TaxID=153505 RepID=A0AAD6UWG7_9AGAR|nr:hypothetical protein GGX14DRAFT_577033 [Mycena pura]
MPRALPSASSAPAGPASEYIQNSDITYISKRQSLRLEWDTCREPCLLTFSPPTTTTHLVSPPTRKQRVEMPLDAGSPTKHISADQDFLDSLPAHQLIDFRNYLFTPTYIAHNAERATLKRSESHCGHISPVTMVTHAAAPPSLLSKATSGCALPVTNTTHTHALPGSRMCLAIVTGDARTCLAFYKADGRACLDVVKGDARACLAIVTGDARACLAFDKADGRACLAIVKGDACACLAFDKGDSRACLAAVKGDSRACLAAVKGDAHTCMASDKHDARGSRR